MVDIVEIVDADVLIGVDTIDDVDVMDKIDGNTVDGVEAVLAEDVYSVGIAPDIYRHLG